MKFQKFTPHRLRQLMVLRKSVGWKSRALSIYGLSVNPERVNKKVRGDQWRLAKNPLMAKLVFSMVPSIKEVSE